MDLKVNLHKFAKLKGISLRQLAAEIGISPSTLFYYENKPDGMSIATALKIANILGITVEQLTGTAEYCSSKEIMQLKRENVRLKNALIRVRRHLQNECGDILEDVFPEKEG